VVIQASMSAWTGPYPAGMPGIAGTIGDGT
jgi:hypothetical protein